MTPLSAPAQTPPATAVGHYVMPQAAVVFGDGDRQADDGWRLGITHGLQRGDHWQVEGQGFYERLGTVAGNYSTAGVLVSGLYFVHRQMNFHPFARAGLGLSRASNSNSGNGQIHLELGGGFEAPLAGALAPMRLRVELTYRQQRRLSDRDSFFAFADTLVQWGLVIPLKQPPPPAPPLSASAPPPPADGDGDRDGVADSLDACPASLAGERVNPIGCPADLDNDGVGDMLDRCPHTAPHMSVDRHGCEQDSDQDGVIDRLDVCPDTPKGLKVDPVGCPIIKVIRLKGVKFKFDSAKLTAASTTVLNGVAKTLKANRELRVEVAGHTDSRGSDDYNRKLSQQRAQAVVHYLIGRGISKAMLSAKGYGESQPITTNKTPKGQSTNRRVELRISTRH